ncbi:MAG: hypothetical protein AAGC44_13555 [Planctomycetota bacterium]
MNNTKLACLALLASAFVLTGILLVQIDRNTTSNEARADMVIAQPQFSLMTAQTRQGNESLFVLDNNKGVLLVYKPNFGRKELEPVVTIPMSELFGR